MPLLPLPALAAVHNRLFPAGEYLPAPPTPAGICASAQLGPTMSCVELSPSPDERRIFAAVVLLEVLLVLLGMCAVERLLRCVIARRIRSEHSPEPAPDWTASNLKDLNGRNLNWNSDWDAEMGKIRAPAQVVGGGQQIPDDVEAAGEEAGGELLA
ncbi:hypothetical protein MIND_01264100 [Mycena indigotica]|uniref:Uncharacterized protein n=1 Tax=Mycena indigotica TaxID=2126181 RepID=A0A8H6S3J8_9AGAR|nr:uncharacterized protein MIND_01264100 [Mycena indigotica]KAF7291207.1 hypothetical protein MIND_01264100 [Mycena indigotica]